MNMASNIKKTLIVMFEFLYLCFFSAQIFAIIFPGDPMPWGYIIFTVAYSTLHFFICRILIRKNIISRRMWKILLGTCAVMLTIYLFSGIRASLRMFSSPSVNDIERVKALFLCMLEILYRTICIHTSSSTQ